MAQVALGKNCPKCQSLCAPSGSYADEDLQTQCGACGAMVSMPNPYFTGTPGAVEVAPEEVEQEVTAEAPPEATAVAVQSTGDEQEPGDDQG